MSANLIEEFSITTKRLDVDSLCTLAREIVGTANEDLTRWHPQGTPESARSAANITTDVEHAAARLKAAVPVSARINARRRPK